MSKKFIRLKDSQGNTLLPSAYKDDLGQIIKNTYVSKTGKDFYIKEAYVEDAGNGVKKLTLINRATTGSPIEFYAYDPYENSNLLQDCLNKIEMLEERVKELENEV